MDLTRTVTTVAELREFLSRCDQLGVPHDAKLHARTGFGLTTAGPPLRALTVRDEEAGQPRPDRVP